MNRREFFGRFASVPIAASLVVPELTRTIFLPPRGGWLEHLHMREVALYEISRDQLVYRWDCAWDDGYRAVQYHIDGYGNPDISRELVRERMLSIRNKLGFKSRDAIKLSLPVGPCIARYV